MERLAKLRESFLEQAHSGGPPAFHDATVTAIDTEAYTCDVLLDDEVEVFEVRLRAVVSSNQSIDVLPAVNASIVVGKIGEDDFILIAADVITSYRVTIGAMVLKVDATGFQLSNGTTSLKDVLTGFVTQMLAIYAPKDIAGIENLQTLINSLLV
ncbi:hypothetical protein [uncultured Mucilaginibacter sp.]|uniref:hypothetical protein n=1 Tax=uncultured Mucilaginibacter sp. TaxID=797541 RepID=UPI0025D3A407|nr:hypothetical protein [uncultured Mucilaginibacter sp.]